MNKCSIRDTLLPPEVSQYSAFSRIPQVLRLVLTILLPMCRWLVVVYTCHTTGETRQDDAILSHKLTYTHHWNRHRSSGGSSRLNTTTTVTPHEFVHERRTSVWNKIGILFIDGVLCHLHREDLAKLTRKQQGLKACSEKGSYCDEQKQQRIRAGTRTTRQEKQNRHRLYSQRSDGIDSDIAG